MPYDKTIISNMTLGHLSIGLTIGDFETENSAEADACRLWFDPCTRRRISCRACWMRRHIDGR